MRKLLLLLFVAIGHMAFAQEEPYYPDMRCWMLYKGDTTERYIFSDTAFIRSSPDTKQAPIDTLLAGDNITVVEMTNKALTIRGLNGPWLKINYFKNGEQKNGYIWQGLISCQPLRRGDIKYAFGVERRADSIAFDGKNRDTFPRLLIRVKAIQNGVILGKAAVMLEDGESAGSTTAKIMSGMGLTNVQNIIVLQFSGEACGIPTYDHYFAMTKDNKLVNILSKTNVGDAGAFYHSEEYIFPNEKNGKPDTIFWDMMEEEAGDKVDKNGDYILELKDKKKKTYQWNGETYTITEVK